MLRQLLHLHEDVQELLTPARNDIGWADRTLLSGRQAHALFLLRSEPMSMGQMAEQLGAPRPAATAAVNRLVSLGLAERVRDVVGDDGRTDRRLVHVLATDRGRRVIAERNLWEHTALASMAAVLTARPGLQPERALEELLRLLEAARQLSERAAARRKRARVDGRGVGLMESELA